MAGPAQVQNAAAHRQGGRGGTQSAGGVCFQLAGTLDNCAPAVIVASISQGQYVGGAIGIGIAREGKAARPGDIVRHGQAGIRIVKYPPAGEQRNGATGQQKLVAAGGVIILIDAAVLEIKRDALVSSVVIGHNHQRRAGANNGLGAGRAAAIIPGVVQHQYAPSRQGVPHASEHTFNVGSAAGGNTDIPRAVQDKGFAASIYVIPSRIERNPVRAHQGSQGHRSSRSGKDRIIPTRGPGHLSRSAEPPVTRGRIPSPRAAAAWRSVLVAGIPIYGRTRGRGCRRFANDQEIRQCRRGAIEYILINDARGDAGNVSLAVLPHVPTRPGAGATGTAGLRALAIGIGHPQRPLGHRAVQPRPIARSARGVINAGVHHRRDDGTIRFAIVDNVLAPLVDPI